MAEEKKGASALSSSSSRSATSHSDDKTEAKSATRRTSSGKQSTSRTTSPRKRTTAKTPRASRTTKAATAAAVANGEVPAQSIPVADPSQFGRIAVMDVTPNEESGRFPARVELGEPFKVTAQVFIEGRTKVGATAIVRNHRGKEMQRLPMTCTNPGLDRWEVMLTCGEHSDVKPWQPEFAAIKRQLGEWSVTIEGWEDTYKSWLHDAAIKVKVNDDVENALESGAQLLERWAKTADAKLSAAQRKMLVAAAATMKDTSLTPEDRLAAATSEPVAQLHLTNPLRDGVSPSQPQRFLVQRPESSFAAWYQFFPRSEGAYVDPETGKIVQGTLKTSVSGLERAKAEGFDIVYLPPIFPIGKTNRKGRNNALEAGPDDPGSPFGIGSELGGHDTVDPLLGNMDDFKALVAKAHELGLEIALDFALQCSPDHPWVKQHPDWFRHKPDGSIAFAENPPKKYQDIYPIDFNADMPGIEKEVERVLELWINAGVTIFRIDNPHTKPVRFWQDVIAAVTKKHPEILFLAEAFTRPGMMRALSYVGFTQSHCYFPWRNTKEELGKYLETTNGDDGYYQHNTFWPTTPDILTAYVRDNGIAGHAVRAVLAAMGSPSWGIYNGFELIENKQRPGFEEQIDNEKYEVKVRDWSAADKYGIAELLTNLNRVRREHPKVFSYHNLTVLESSDPNILAFARHTPAELTGTDKPETLIVVVNLDGHEAHQAMVHLELPDYGIDPKWGAHIHDELTGRDFAWSWDNFVSLAPWADVAHIFTVVHED
ncbi:alpha-1,4-glucan--maltose-1-phosphate maltosyltransferase [Bifidobacterium bifidum]|uniref:Alpha-1,4-glucan:maltose-1-phosphate maltosyltransferase n=1 Tax=Bifidobacterium bifidum BGN4 TaxID=484020 RepID=I3WK32_BIFBI|nr:alpha-1,4-glucan--maltose-1-phosphate maltosyltransferase [Bifidobacterium bifidum]GDY92154.1 alpha-1,4-glucan:maltose-1-phosphate maltosyltransferase [Bifidobacteriaceae bacterium MCC01946]GDZ24324.1 alpha-1,4-glucan:maltose-1-phosphate maltosyltransferase [Bifidobacteriaceae bacterium MCC01958]AFL05245.1 putative glycanase or glycogenase [Bifidobacterium bifidum BGN4]MBS6342677.1 alpha-1,4-glucan--maltose-1-phosphate maltosyltransferase [Bifidobacterium bifidum]MDU5849683.1 alpha-1,4-gluc